VTKARRLLVSKDQYSRNKLLPLALIEARKGHIDQSLAQRRLIGGWFTYC
jgi:hypothetical protein